jgi:hypothetical protein
MDRNKVFIIRNRADKSKKVVGSTCLKDFLGHDVTHMLQYFESLHEVWNVGRDPEEDDFVDGSNLDFFSNVVFGSIFATKGKFYSKKNMEQNNYFCTAINVSEYIFCAYNGALPESYPFQFETSDVILYTNNVIEEMKALSEKVELSSFERNIVNCYKLGFVPSNLYNSVVGYIGNWWIKNGTPTPSDFNPKLSEYIGKEGEKVELNVVIDKAIESNSDYGGVIIFGHVIGTNNKFAWYTTSANSLYTQSGNLVKASEGEFKIKATIKNLKADEKFVKFGHGMDSF